MAYPITIIDKIKPPAAKFIADPLPDFSKLSLFEWEKWKEKEFTKWVNGYGGLTGRHYAYLTINFLKNIKGQAIRPMWRDGDEFVFQADEESRKGFDLMIVKRREFGLTSIYGGFEPIYNCIVYPGSIQLLTSAGVKRMSKMFAEKTMFTYTHLPLPKVLVPAAKKGEKASYEFKDLPILRKTKAGELELGREDKFGNPDPDCPISRISSVQTSDSPESAKGFESDRAMSGFVDELFLHPYAEIVHASGQATFSEGFVKTGHFVFGGSCGLDDKATLEDAEALRTGAAMGKRLWDDADAKGIKRVFLPGWMCIDKASEYDKNGIPTGKILSFMSNGWSNEKAATEYILKRRDFLDKAKNKDMLRNFIKQYPLSIQEVFESNSSPVFPESVYAGFEEAERAIRENPGLVTANKLFRQQHTVNIN